MKSSSVLKLVVLLAVVVSLGAYGVMHLKSQAAMSDEVAAAGRVHRMDLIQRVTISGQIMPSKRLDVRPQFKGYVTKLYVKIGDRVKTNDPLVTFSPSLASGETNYPVRSAFNGIVTQVLRQEGEAVSDTQSGDPGLVVRVEDISQLYVLASVPELDIAKVKLGQQALVRVSALSGESFEGKISEINLSARDKDRWSSSSTEFQIRVALGKNQKGLMPGLSAVMDVITDKRENVLALPHEYVEQDNEGYFVTTNTGEKKRVKVGLQTDEAVETLSGVSENESVRAIDFLTLPKLKD